MRANDPAVLLERVRYVVVRRARVAVSLLPGVIVLVSLVAGVAIAMAEPPRPDAGDAEASADRAVTGLEPALKLFRGALDDLRHTVRQADRVLKRMQNSRTLSEKDQQEVGEIIEQLREQSARSDQYLARAAARFEAQEPRSPAPVDSPPAGVPVWALAAIFLAGVMIGGLSWRGLRARLAR